MRLQTLLKRDPKIKHHPLQETLEQRIFFPHNPEATKVHIIHPGLTFNPQPKLELRTF